MTSDPRRPVLDPIDRISEILFGLIMAVTIMGSLSIATAGAREVREVALAALGCNIAWGLVDALMFLMRTVTERTRARALVQRALGADDASADRLIASELPEGFAALAGAEEISGMRRRLRALRVDGRPLLHRRDYLSALGIFLLVVAATFPVVVPFLLFDTVAVAFKVSRIVTIVMMFAAGAALGRHASHPRPLVTGIVMAALGVAVIAIVMALGG